MLTSKQKSYLKGLAHNLNPVFQIGKEGIQDNMKYDIVAYLAKHELMKVSILNNSDVNIEVVQTIGKIMVLYKKSKKAKNPIILPK